MFFYIDESGQTGNNLFDDSQPFLCYGVLSSRVNIDLLANSHMLPIRKKLGVDRLHANHLGNSELRKIALDIEKVRKKFDLKFDMYRIAKKDHAMISFFDQVFDQGVNPAIPWSSYWTPLRYVLLLKLSYLFDREVLEKAWNARLTIRKDIAEKMLVEVCEEILERVHELPDKRSRQIIRDGLCWAAANPGEINYNVSNKKDRLQISPNLIGFQTVMHGIASRLKRTKRKATKVIVDRQTQFNNAQEWIATLYNEQRDIPWVSGPGLPIMDLKHMPDVPIQCTPGDQSIGLELVDLYLWIFKRLKEEKELAPELYLLVKGQLAKSKYDEVSLEAISERWSSWFSQLPEPDSISWGKVQELRRFEEERRKPFVL